MLNLIAIVIALVAVVATLAHVGYLALMKSVAEKKGASGERFVRLARSRWPVAGVTTVGALLAWALTSGGGFADVVAIVLAAGAGGMAAKSLGSARKTLESGQ